MIRLVLIVAAVQLLTSQSHSNEIVNAFRELDRDTRWKIEDTVALDFETYHPQGLTRVRDRHFLSSVEVIDRAKGIGKGHLFVFDHNGSKLDQLSLAEGQVYHPGGIDFDGTHIWLCLAEYRPDSSSIIYRIDPDSLDAQEVFRFDDHLGAIVHLASEGLLIAANWDSKTLYKWTTKVDASGAITVEKVNSPIAVKSPNRYINYQDMQRVPGTSLIFASGLQTYRQPGRNGPAVEVGGIDLIDAKSTALLTGLPVRQWTATGISMNKNPFYVEASETGLRFRFIPEDNASTMYVIVPR